ncbi:MAG TPA: type II toxin-antitoxin system ParD family antitoxin [Lichenihabitans sp.]|jgi:antitoxin ParD1/3/4|nr:type II toxin-antitoxin system ParD family antitoxin [Lichenihabitans sp.]
MPRSVDLSQELEDEVQQLVKTGRFHSSDDVLREGVRLVKERENHLRALDTALDRGLADAQAGRVKPAGEVAARLVAKYVGVVDEPS